MNVILEIDRRYIISSTLTYTSYIGGAELDAEDRLVVRRIVGIRDVIGLHVGTLTSLEKVFREAIPDYVKGCAKFNQAPNEAVSVNMLWRIYTDLREKASDATTGRCESERMGRIRATAGDATSMHAGLSARLTVVA